MRPTTADVRPVGNPLLSNMLIAYMNDDMDYVARRAAPVVPVAEESGTYTTFDKKHWFADKLERRAYGDRRARAGWTAGSDTYKTLQWALEHPIPDEQQATSQIPMRLEQVGLQWIAQQSNLRKEIAFAADFMTTGVWTTNPTPTDWDDSSGVPITDARTYRRTIKQLTGKTANAITMGEIVFDALIVNAQVREQAKYTRTLIVAESEGLIAALLGFQYVFVSRAIYNTANIGQAASLAPVIDDVALIHIVEPGTDMMSVTSLKTFVWQPGGGEGSAKSYYDDGSDSTILAHKEQWDQKLISADTGVFFSDIV